MTGHANVCVHIRLSPWAPGCIDLPWSDPRLRRDYWSTPLVKVVASLLRRLGRAPGEITLVEATEGDIEFRGDIPPDLAADHVGPGILVILWGGPSLGQVQAALNRLEDAGWRPSAVPFSPSASQSAPFHTPFEGAPA